jgi:hypothetical protein
MTGLTKAAIGSMQAANKKGTNDIGGSHTLWVPINYVLALGNHALLYPSSTYDTHTHTHIHTYIHTVLGTASNRIQKMTLKSYIPSPPFSKALYIYIYIYINLNNSNKVLSIL